MDKICFTEAVAISATVLCVKVMLPWWFHNYENQVTSDSIFPPFDMDRLNHSPWKLNYIIRFTFKNIKLISYFWDHEWFKKMNWIWKWSYHKIGIVYKYWLVMSGIVKSIWPEGVRTTTILDSSCPHSRGQDRLTITRMRPVNICFIIPSFFQGNFIYQSLEFYWNDVRPLVKIKDNDWNLKFFNF